MPILETRAQPFGSVARLYIQRQNLDRSMHTVGVPIAQPQRYALEHSELEPLVLRTGDRLIRRRYSQRIMLPAYASGFMLFPIATPKRLAKRSANPS